MKYLRDKRDGDLWGWTPQLAENPDMEEVEINSFAKSEPVVEQVKEVKSKRKTYKELLKQKAEQLDGGADEEASMGQTEPKQEEQAPESGAESQG